MRVKPLSRSQIQNNFNTALQDAIDTGNLPSDGMGLNSEMIATITVVAQQYPNVEATSIQNARLSWRRYASGAIHAERAATLVGFYPDTP